MKSGGNKQYLIEIGGINHLCKRGVVRTVTDLSSVSGCAWYVADMPGSAPQLATVETEAKYAEVLLRKRLQDSGEFEGQIELIAHWKKERSKNFSVGFFTSVGFDLFTNYMDKCRNAPDSVLFFPLFSVLYRILLKQTLSLPCALVFRHGQFADLIIASSREVYTAMRLNAFDLSETQIASLWGTIAEEIRHCQESNRFTVKRVYYLNWFDAEPEPLWYGQQEFTTVLLPQAEYEVDGERRKTSFIRALSLVSIKDSASSSELLALEYCRQLLPVANLLLLLAAILCAGAAFWVTGEKAKVEDKLNSLQGNLATLKNVKPIPDVKYQDVMSFVKDVATAGRSSKFTDVLDEINGSIFEGATVKSLEATYGPADMRLKVTGEVRTGVSAAIAGYNTMQRKLKEKGYEVIESTFNTDISEATFILTLRRDHRNDG